MINEKRMRLALLERLSKVANAHNRERLSYTGGRQAETLRRVDRDMNRLRPPLHSYRELAMVTPLSGHNG